MITSNINILKSKAKILGLRVYDMHFVHMSNNWIPIHKEKEKGIIIIDNNDLVTNIAHNYENNYVNISLRGARVSCSLFKWNQFLELSQSNLCNILYTKYNDFSLYRINPAEVNIYTDKNNSLIEGNLASYYETKTYKVYMYYNFKTITFLNKRNNEIKIINPCDVSTECDYLNLNNSGNNIITKVIKTKNTLRIIRSVVEIKIDLVKDTYSINILDTNIF